MTLDGLPKYPNVSAKSLTDPVLTVSLNRRRFVWLAVVSGVACVGSVVPLWNVFYHIEPDFLRGFLLGIPGGLLGGSIAALLVSSRPVLTYHVVTRTVEAHDRWWGRLRTYPRRECGYERLEYSIYSARLYEVRPDGHRHEIFLGRWWIHRGEWKAFVDRFLWDQEQAEQAAATEPDIDGSSRRKRL